jgi:hypothetical protein
MPLVALFFQDVDIVIGDTAFGSSLLGDLEDRLAYDDHFGT